MHELNAALEMLQIRRTIEISAKTARYESLSTWQLGERTSFVLSEVLFFVLKSLMKREKHTKSGSRLFREEYSLRKLETEETFAFSVSTVH